MSTNKNAIIRYQELDKCFRNIGRKYFIDDLVEACNEALYEYNGDTEGIKKRQLFDDLNFMQSEQGWSIPLEKKRDGKKVYYRYEDPNFSIKSQPLNNAEALLLKEALLTLKRFKGLPQFEWLEELVTRLETSFSLSPNDVKSIEFDQNPYLKGLNFITELFQSISYKRVINVGYKGYKQTETSYFDFHPYYLKQYNSRWFIIGHNDSFGNISNLALDRIQEINSSNTVFKTSDIDFNYFFEDIVGVTKPDEASLEKIILEIDNSLYPYIESKPLHGSQKVIERKDSSTIVELSLILNFEFETLIFSHGERVKVLKPTVLIETIKNKAKAILENY